MEVIFHFSEFELIKESVFAANFLITHHQGFFSSLRRLDLGYHPLVHHLKEHQMISLRHASFLSQFTLSRLQASLFHQQYPQLEVLKSAQYLYFRGVLYFSEAFSLSCSFCACAQTCLFSFCLFCVSWSAPLYHLDRCLRSHCPHRHP